MSLTDEQKAKRRFAIGGSDAAAALGLSRWKTPMRLWAEKTGQIEADDISDRLSVEVGIELEDLVCKLFTKRTGKEVRRVNECLVHPNYPFLVANIDRRIVGEDAILEAKTCSAWKAKDWEGENIPQEYICQVMHYLAVTGKQRAYVAVLIGGNQDFRWKCVERDPAIIGTMEKRLAEFWIRYVEPKVMPAIITKDDGDLLYQFFPNAPEDSQVELGDTANALIEGLEGMQSDYKTLEGQIEQQKNELKLMLGENLVGVTDKYRVSWRPQETGRIDVKRLKEEEPAIAEEYLEKKRTRVLRVNKIQNPVKEKTNV